MEQEKDISKKRDDIGCELWIYTGERNPDFVTEKTGIVPSRIREKGKPWFEYGKGRPNEHRVCEENIWIFSHRITINDETTYLGQPLSELLEIIKPKENFFKEIFLDPKFVCLILCFGYYHRYHIYFRLSPGVLKKVNELNLMLDFDLYSFKEKSASK